MAEEITGPVETIYGAVEPTEQQKALGRVALWAPGHYVCRCAICKTRHIADKRAAMCFACAAANEIAQLRDRLASASASGSEGWQPPDTAPHDGNDVLWLIHADEWVSPIQFVGRWEYQPQGFCIQGGHGRWHERFAKAWRPLPPPPEPARHEETK